MDIRVYDIRILLLSLFKYNRRMIASVINYWIVLWFELYIRLCFVSFDSFDVHSLTLTMSSTFHCACGGITQRCLKVELMISMSYLEALMLISCRTPVFVPFYPSSSVFFLLGSCRLSEHEWKMYKYNMLMNGKSDWTTSDLHQSLLCDDLFRRTIRISIIEHFYLHIFCVNFIIRSH